MERDLTVIKGVLADMGFRSRGDRENTWEHEISNLIVFNIDDDINFTNYQLVSQGSMGALVPSYTFSQDQINNESFVVARILKAVAQNGYKTGRNELRSELGQLLAQEA